MNRNDLRKQKRGNKRKRIILFSILLLLIIALIPGYYFLKAYYAVNESYNEVENRDGKSKLREEEVSISSDPVSILLLGIEDYTDNNDRGRSDTIMVATFNPTQQNMKLVSIPRDTYVEIDGLRYKDKINHSYSSGGKERTIETVENFLEIPIDYYVTVDFQGFKNIVDELGGVTVEVPFDFSDINSKNERYYFQKGEMELNGEEALVYARMRRKDPRGDFGRNDRQKQIVMSALDKLTAPNTLLKIDDIAEEIGDNVETNIRVKEALAFRKKYSNFNPSKIETLNISGYDKWIDDVYYFEADEKSLAELKEELQSHLNHSVESTDNLTNTN